MTKETVVDRALRKRLERERDLLTELAHQIVAKVEEGIEKRWDVADVTLDKDVARILRQSELAKDFLLLALSANGIDRCPVTFFLENKEGFGEIRYISVDLKNLQNLPFNDD